MLIIYKLLLIVFGLMILGIVSSIYIEWLNKRFGADWRKHIIVKLIIFIAFVGALSPHNHVSHYIFGIGTGVIWGSFFFQLLTISKKRLIKSDVPESKQSIPFMITLVVIYMIIWLLICILFTVIIPGFLLKIGWLSEKADWFNIWLPALITPLILACITYWGFRRPMWVSLLVSYSTFLIVCLLGLALKPFIIHAPLVIGTAGIGLTIGSIFGLYLMEFVYCHFGWLEWEQDGLRIQNDISVNH